MTSAQALAFIREHGVVLASAKGPAPRLAEAIVGEPIKGSWWAHPKSHQIYAILQDVANDADVLVCRLVGGKVSYVHRRLWPALVRLAGRFPADRIARVCEEHTPAGRHVNHEMPFPNWVPAEVMRQANVVTDVAALAELGAWASVSAQRRLGRPRSRSNVDAP